MSDRDESSDKQSDLAEKRRELAEHQRKKYMRTMANRGDVIEMVEVYHAKWVAPLMAEVRVLRRRVKELEDGR